MYDVKNRPSASASRNSPVQRVGVVAADGAGVDQALGRREEAEDPVGDVEVARNQGLRMCLDIVETGVEEQRDHSAADPARRKAVAPRVENRACQRPIRRVDRQRLPVVVERDQHSAGAKDPGHLADRRRGIGDVLKHPVDAAAVESPFAVGQLGRIGDLERQACDVAMALRAASTIA